jgi:exonuclease VII small subunit
LPIRSWQEPFAVSNSQPASEATLAVPVHTQPVDPRKNPSYPQRIHAGERPHWDGVLKKCDERIATARQKMNVLGNSPSRSAYEYLFAQMLGARDQVADAARRLPMETGDLYEEDKHRLEEGVAALDRVFKRWDSQRG